MINQLQRSIFTGRTNRPNVGSIEEFLPLQNEKGSCSLQADILLDWQVKEDWDGSNRYHWRIRDTGNRMEKLSWGDFPVHKGR